MFIPSMPPFLSALTRTSSIILRRYNFNFFFQYTFIGYSDPDFKYFRCAVDVCEKIGNTSFEANFVNFAIPPQNNDSKEDSACLMYETINSDGPCSAANFNKNATIPCSAHVFSNEIPYEFSLTEQLDMPSCPNDPNWDLNVSIVEP